MKQYFSPSRLTEKDLCKCIREERGSITLSSEALVLLALAVVGFAAVTFLLTKTDSAMDERSKWVECADVLDCEHIDQQNKTKPSETK